MLVAKFRQLGIVLFLKQHKHAFEYSSVITFNTTYSITNFD